MQYSLLKGEIILIDEEDYKSISQFNWWLTNSGGVVRNVKINDVRTLQTLGKYLTGSKDLVMHKNNNCFDFRRNNLIFGSHTNRLQKASIQKINKSGYKGVYWDKTHNKYRSQIIVDKVKFRLGDYDDPMEAAMAYDNAAKKYFGEFARINFS